METKETIITIERLLKTSNLKEVKKAIVEAGPKENNHVLEFLNNLSIYGIDALNKNKIIDNDLADLANDCEDSYVEEESDDNSEVKMFASFLQDNLSFIFDENIGENSEIDEGELLLDIKGNIEAILEILKDL